MPWYHQALTSFPVHKASQSQPHAYRRSRDLHFLDLIPACAPFLARCLLSLVVERCTCNAKVASSILAGGNGLPFSHSAILFFVMQLISSFSAPCFPSLLEGKAPAHHISNSILRGPQKHQTTPTTDHSKYALFTF